MPGSEGGSAWPRVLDWMAEMSVAFAAGGIRGLPAGPQYWPWCLLGVVVLLYIGGFWSGA